MFRCQLCQAVLPAGTKAARLVVSTREKVYEPRGADPANRRFGGRRGPSARNKKRFDKGGTGNEIVREVVVCPELAQAVANGEEFGDAQLTSCPHRNG